MRELASDICKLQTDESVKAIDEMQNLF